MAGTKEGGRKYSEKAKELRDTTLWDRRRCAKCGTWGRVGREFSYRTRRLVSGEMAIYPASYCKGCDRARRREWEERKGTAVVRGMEREAYRLRMKAARASEGRQGTGREIDVGRVAWWFADNEEAYWRLGEARQRRLREDCARGWITVAAMEKLAVAVGDLGLVRVWCGVRGEDA